VASQEGKDSTPSLTPQLTLAGDDGPTPAADDSGRTGSDSSVNPADGTVNLEGEDAPSADPGDGTIALDPAGIPAASDGTIALDGAAPGTPAASDGTVALEAADLGPSDRTVGGAPGAADGTIACEAGSTDFAVDESPPSHPPKARDKTVVGADRGPPTGQRQPLRTKSVPGKKDAKLPTKVAGYDILGELGRGGMGVVYKAKQAGLNRLCALKMVLGGGHASADNLARFKIEAEAIAQLHHPNIVQVYEIGEEAGCPFFSLEYIDGSSLQQKIDSTPQSATETAQLMQEICEGVYAAHQRGVLHRDLKPANILLTKEGQPKITDFGLAKRLEEQDHGQTRTGAIMGTPSYMAPEQAMGKAKHLGPPADIYSLGAILYDMLTGRPPFRGETVMETLNQVQTLEPLPPVRLAPKVPLDLQTICLKALDKDPRKRYDSAGAMAEDLRRYLAGEPIQARPTPLWERAVKWVKRRPAVATLIGVSCLAVVSLLALGALWLNSERQAAEDREEQQKRVANLAEQGRTEAERLQKIAEDNEREANRQKKIAEDNEREAKTQEKIALQQKGIAEAQRLLAEQRLKQTRQAVDKMLTNVGFQTLVYEPRMEKIRRVLVEEALAIYLKLLDGRRDDLDLLFEAGLVHHRVGEIYSSQGKLDDSAKQYGLAAAIFGELLAKDAHNVEYREAQAACEMELAKVANLQGRLDVSEKGYKRALQLFSSLATDKPTVVLYKEEMANLYANLGDIHLLRGRIGDAEASYDKAIELRLAFPPQLAKGPGARQRLARFRLNRGAILLEAGKIPEAEKSLLAARAEFKALSQAAPEVPDYAFDWASSCLNLGNFYRKTNNLKAAALSFQEAVGLFQSLQKSYPYTPVFRQDLGRANYELGMTFGAQREFAQARDQLSKALDLQKRLFNDQPKQLSTRLQLAQCYISLGVASVELGDHEGGLYNYQKGVDLLEEVQPKARDAWVVCVELCRGYQNLADLQTALKQTGPAAESRQRLLELRQDMVAAQPDSAQARINLAATHQRFAEILLKGGKAGPACKHLTDAVAQWEKAAALVPKDASVRQLLMKARFDLGAAHLANDDHAAAADQAAKLYGTVDKQPADHDFNVALLCGRCMLSANDDERLDAAQRKAVVKGYGDQAMKALDRAVARGFKDATQIETAEELQLLRDRPDFLALVEKAKGAAKGGG
jgi:serine/threonine protein kinase/tetratricopeptide (TPR) repeat protein